ncbi:MAG: LptF/LptG family permease [Candidatus Ratteibacteria bacterium]
MKKKFLYIFLNFMKFFLVISIIFLIFFIVIQFLDDLTDFLKYKREIFFKNYIYTSPLLFVQISPIITILSLMLVLSEMIKNCELRVFFISGIKPLYIFSIFLICGFFSSILSFAIKNFVSPPLIKKLNYSKPKFPVVFSSPKYFFYSEKFDGENFINVKFTEFLNNGEIIILKAEKAKNYRDEEWVFINGQIWKFDNRRNLIYKEEFITIEKVKMFLTSEILSVSEIDVEKFSFFQLQKIIKKMKELKLKPVSLISYLYEKISYPILNFFITFVIYQFLTKRGKFSNLYVFSFAFLFSLFLYGIFIFFFSLSKNGKIPQIFGLWTVHFFILIYFFVSSNLKRKV